MSRPSMRRASCRAGQQDAAQGQHVPAFTVEGDRFGAGRFRAGVDDRTAPALITATRGPAVPPATRPGTIGAAASRGVVQ